MHRKDKTPQYTGWLPKRNHPRLQYTEIINGFPKALSLLALCAYAIWAIPASAAMVLDKVVAVVNNEAITWSELNSAMETELKQLTSTLPQNEKRKLFASYEPDIIDGMIDKSLELQEAQRLGMSVSPEEAEAAILNIRTKYGLDEDSFYKAVKDEGYDRSSYGRIIAEQILIGRVVEREVKSRIIVTQNDVSQYLDKKGLKHGRQFRLRQIFFKASPQTGADMLYAKAAEIIRMLDQGGDFLELAAGYSESPRGGDLGYIEQEHMSKEFQDSLKGLSTGGISRPFITNRGIHIVRIEEIREADESLRQELFERRYAQWLKSLRDKSFIDVRL